MKIKYIGGRALPYYVSFNRMKYHFTKDNNKILETEDQVIVDHISRLENSYDFQFLVAENVPEIEKVVTKNIIPVKKKTKSDGGKK